MLIHHVAFIFIYATSSATFLKMKFDLSLYLRMVLWLSLSVLAIMFLKYLTRRLEEVGVLSTDEEDKIKLPPMPRGVHLIRLSSPLGFAALSRAIQMWTEFPDLKMKVVLIWVRETYPLAEEDNARIDFAIESLERLKMKPVVVSRKYRFKIRDSKRGTISRNGVRVTVAPTLEEGLKIAQQLSERIGTAATMSPR